MDTMNWPELTWGGNPFNGTQLDGWVGILSVGGTLAAVIVSVVAALRAERRAKSAEDRANELAEKATAQAERAQAAKVDVVIISTRQAFRVFNRSEQVIRQVRVSAYVPQNPVFHSQMVDQLLPGMDLHLKVKAWKQPAAMGNIVTYAVTFYDDDGRYWAKFQSGEMFGPAIDTVETRKAVHDRLEETWPALAAFVKEQLDELI